MNSTLELEVTAFTKAQLIRPEAPQIALAGRSNVGKSSLVNALAGRRNMARVSATPGKTRSINYYLAMPGNFYVVDLPGYGYARCSKTEQRQWAELLEHYLTHTPGLAALALLLDARLPPQKADVSLASYAASLHLPLLPVLTKADKCAKKEISLRRKEWAAILPGAPLLLTSAEKRLGIEDLWDALRRAVYKTPG